MWAAIPVLTQTPDVWSWLSDTISAQSIIQGLGLAALAILFATNRILTLGQHNTRTNDLIRHHTAELALKDALYNQMVAEKDRAYAEMKESRNYWQTSATNETHRADAATQQLTVVSEEGLGLAVQMVRSLQEAVEGVPPDGR
jgi:hypothetical protein